MDGRFDGRLDGKGGAIVDSGPVDLSMPMVAAVSAAAVLLRERAIERGEQA